MHRNAKVGMPELAKWRVRLLRLAGGLLFSLFVALATAEVLLRVASLFASDRSGAWAPGARVRILAVGDSHTYGAGVDAEASYPGQLQAELDRRSPGRYSTLNLGVPGLGTGQVRERLPAWARRYEPDVILVWCGVNDAWNLTGATRSGFLPPWLDGFLSRSKVFRFLAVWVHDRKLEKAALLAGEGAMRHVLEADRPLDPRATKMATMPGVVERIETTDVREFSADAAMEERAYRDYVAMIEWARSRGIELLFLAYPTEVGAFARANSALRRAARKYAVPLVETAPAVQRVPEKERKFLWALHPNAAMYREIARDVAEKVLEITADR